MTLVTQYAQIDTTAWENLLKMSPVSSWFQSKEAYCFFDSLRFMDAFVVAVTEGDDLKGITVGYIQCEGVFHVALSSLADHYSQKTSPTSNCLPC